MKTKLSYLMLILALVIPAYPAILSEDQQVVIPTGQPLPEASCNCQNHSSSHNLELFFRWDDKSVSSLFAQDQLCGPKIDNYQTLQDLQRLQKSFQGQRGTEIKVTCKSLNIHVILE